MGSASVAYANEFKPYQVVPPNPRYDSQSAWNVEQQAEVYQGSLGIGPRMLQGRWGISPRGASVASFVQRGC